LVSDIHLGMMISNGKLNRLVELVNQQNADLVLLAGDVFDEDLGPVIQNNMGDLLKNLRAKQGVYAILGNHEFFGNADAAQKYLENHNITVLRDSTVTLQNGITIVGREDITGERMNGKPRKSIDKLLAGIDTEKPVFMLDHQPYKLAEVARHKIDLQVSGHTHHGQMWPFNYITSAMFEISRGYGKINDTHFYVSSGFGTWGPPIRTNSRSEIIVLEITGK
jgi:predicted MPP superfamily phosphohydrolase